MRRLAGSAIGLRPDGWAAVVASLGYVIAVRLDVPLLRQDWGISPFHVNWQQILSIGFSGWSPLGIGELRPYPETFLLSVPIALVTFVAGNNGALFLFLLFTGVLGAFGGRAVARDAGSGVAVASAAAVFAVFNPWTYSQLVAGHTYMLLAYAATIWLLREVLAPSPRPAVLIVCALLTTAQLQFLAISTVLLVVIALRHRLWRPLVLIAVVWLPAIVGIIGERAALGAIDFTLSWERNQSIIPFDALQLNGYFAHYADCFRGFFAVSVLVTAAIAILAVIVVRGRQVFIITGGTLAAMVFAMGTRGPFAMAFSWGVLHLHEIALFRELFDVLAYVAIGYIFLGVVACARWKMLAYVWLAATLLLPAVWIASPPGRFWVLSGALPSAAIPAAENLRFALLPPVQPLSFDGEGSGADPDAYERSNGETPLNEYIVTYPVDAAFAAFLAHGDVHPLEALSVANVIARPWLKVATDALRQQLALPIDLSLARKSPSLRLDPAPELTLLPMPAVGTLDARFGSGNIFFGDAAIVRGPLVPDAWRKLTPILPIVAPNREVHADRDWVDARLMYMERPDLAQPIGGAITTDPNAQLIVSGGLKTLVYVEGVLRSSADGRVITGTTNGYRWIDVPASVRSVTCKGLCVVAAQGNPPRAPFEPPPRIARGLAFRQITPWLAVASLPAGEPAAVRYNVAYGTGWAAYLGNMQLTHIRLDGIVNGWLLPSRSNTLELLLVERIAAAQFLSELLALAVLIAVGVYEIRKLWLR